MTIARPVGLYPTGPITLPASVSRAAAFAAAGVLAALNAQADHVINALRYQSMLSAVASLAGISAVIWIAMFAALKVGFEDHSSRLSGRDMAVLAVVVLLSFLPISFAAHAGLLGCGLYLFATSREGNASRRIALVLLALTGPLLWGRILLHMFAQPILSLDAGIVGGLIDSPVDGNVVRIAQGKVQMLIGDQCSSVHNISLAIVLWTTAAALFRVRIDRKYVWVGFLMVALMFVLNVVRLATIGLFPEHFEFLHVGTGAVVIGWAGLIGAGFLAGLGVIGASRRQP